MSNLIWLELNEINIDFIEKYIEMGYLPTFKELIDTHGYERTISENKFEQLEPWIQWVTAHTGKTYAEHKIFRLGDAADQDIDQIWNVLESNYGLKVGAISPMNAGNKTKNAEFFVPDPWTFAKFKGSWDLKFLYDAVVAAVNNNAGGRLSFNAIYKLLVGGLINFRIKSFSKYFHYAANITTGKWYKAMILDVLLADTFIKKWKKSKPDFATLFLNAGAHVQHHYMFSSAAYGGDMKNPPDYIRAGKDPLLDVYQLYDSIIKDIIDSTNSRVMIVTGLSQKPNRRIMYYYRLRDHVKFFNKINLPVLSVEPRMSRDFLVRCETDNDAKLIETVLISMKSIDGKSMFSVDNRGDTLFCMLCYTDEIRKGFIVKFNGGEISDFDLLVDFVTIENAIHKTDGVLIDTGVRTTGDIKEIPLVDVYNRTIAIYNKN